MTDETGEARMAMIAAGVPEEVLAAERAAGRRVWTTAEMTAEFKARGFLAPFVGVRRRCDGMEGSLMFTHSPRFYFAFQASGDDGVRASTPCEHCGEAGSYRDSADDSPPGQFCNGCGARLTDREKAEP